MTGGGACLTGPALSPGSRAAPHSSRSLRAAPLWELPGNHSQESRAGALGWKGCLRVCETGVPEEEGKALDPSLTCVTLDVMSPLWVSVSPVVKWECTEWAARFRVCCESRPMWEAEAAAPQPSPWKGLLLVWMRWRTACSRSRFFTHWIPRFWKLSPLGISCTSPAEPGPSSKPALPSPPLSRPPLHAQPSPMVSCSFLGLTRPSALWPGPGRGPCRPLPSVTGAPPLFSKQAQLIPTARPLHSSTLLGTFSLGLLALPNVHQSFHDLPVQSHANSSLASPTPGYSANSLLFYFHH